MEGKHLETITLEELFQQNTDGNLPFLMDIEHDDIEWEDDALGQDKGHLRLINDSVTVKYQGNKYLPSFFSFVMPSEDGKTVGNTSVTISAIDQRIIKVIRNIKDKPKVTFVALFARKDNTVVFSKLFKYTFEMNSVSWDGVSAKWNLVFDPAMQLQVPRDKATLIRCPSVGNGK
ncbi:MAG: hypothetical protein KBT03_02385 [Bacteroidales bacterium]|nr:hypothetical protein [Candidatus Scybalousia scybalohippi]